jgi:hypothetical protein
LHSSEHPRRGRVFTQPAPAIHGSREDKYRRALARPSASAPVACQFECYPGQQELRIGYPARSMRWSFSGFASRLPPKSKRYRSTPLAYIASVFLTRPKFAFIHGFGSSPQRAKHYKEPCTNAKALHVVVSREISTAIHENLPDVLFYVNHELRCRIVSRSTSTFCASTSSCLPLFGRDTISRCWSQGIASACGRSRWTGTRQVVEHPSRSLHHLLQIRTLPINAPLPP